MGHWINGAANDICIYRRYCVGCDMRPFIVHGNVGGVCLLLLTWSHPWLVEVVVNDWRKFEANSFLCRVAWFWCTGIFKIVKRTYFVSEALLSSSDLGHYWWLLHWLLRTFEKQRRKNNNSLRSQDFETWWKVSRYNRFSYLLCLR